MAFFDEEEGYVIPPSDNERYEDKYLQASTLFRNLIRIIYRYNRPCHIVNTLLETFVNLPSTARAD